MKTYLIFVNLLLFILSTACSKDDAESMFPDNSPGTYYPPINSNEWESVTPESLQWNSSQLAGLLNFLEEKNSKSFIILHRGKIVVEAYFNNHDKTKPWYWASAGKTLTSTIIGIAEDEGYLNLDFKVSEYLGNGWTSAPLEKENLITNRSLLSMTSGLDDTLGDNVSAINLQYKADAGTRWAYHNVYVKLQDVLTNATNNTWSTYFNERLRDRIGMSGSWISNGGLNVYYSDSRSMARFGLLISKNGLWDQEQIIPSNFVHAATNSSQDINQAYGYLWWLNGKNSYRLPQSQLEFHGKLIPNAPDDLYAALGKNDQKLYIVPSEDLVIIRMGESADDENFALSTFDNDLWAKIMQVIE